MRIAQVIHIDYQGFPFARRLTPVDRRSDARPVASLQGA